jgi:hypothetical protein
MLLCVIFFFDKYCLFFFSTPDLIKEKKMVNKTNFAGYVKWLIIGIILYSIWRCIRSDSTNYKGPRESFKPSEPSSEPTQLETKEPTCGGTNSTAKKGTCGGEGGCISKSGTKLLPVLDPCFNMREICKQCILLEDHLFQSEKRCTDCIKKHFLTCESLSEEAITLDKGNKYNFSKLELPEKFRKLERDFLEDKDPEYIAQELRQIRKPLMNKYFDRF